MDTLADVTLNGQPVGHAENAFRHYRWEVAKLLVESENELRVFFSSPVAYVRARQKEQPLPEPSQSIPGGSYLRKAPCQFGWDWGPKLPPIGIWKGIRLEGYTAARLDDVHLRQHHADGAVAVSADVTLERWQDVYLTATLRLTAPDGSVQETETKLEGRPQSPWPIYPFHNA